MAKPPRSHYSPKFANKAWADSTDYISYFHCSYSEKIKKSGKGWKQWGVERGLYSWAVEKALDQELETLAGPIYQKILNYKKLSDDERIVWSQFILSQLVRTPTYMKYEKAAHDIFGITEVAKHCRVGCKDCSDLRFIANRNWYLLLAHEDDFFVRSDNPILQTGFIELPDTCLFYPLSPKLCFVACSMPKDWNAFSNETQEIKGQQLKKGQAHMLNFYLARSAGESLILSPKDDGAIAEKMYGDVLGLYPQPPFPLHSVNLEDVNKAFESIRNIMVYTDNSEYPAWQIKDLEPFYR
ncbi:DUF4238 domain-containing protein [Marinomonas sp. C2222]|uniref:DUF4238 domain-containing protein n=1 Tax=Marinomonas sargassi TaxID=2984494 RepID=A0ABT2YTI2_9GAMM|nr:DUF4238 domain-containing protein [Marinomonas sargassi]MCV2403200.1 DUF4238 domain-containing protein [Marinomonas sargassi]